MVVMSGVATTAGSTPIFYASMGSELPTTFANITVRTIARLTVSATVTVTSGLFIRSLSTSSILTKFTAARLTPQRIETLHSFHTTRSTSAGSVSPRDMLRIIARFY